MTTKFFASVNNDGSLVAFYRTGFLAGMPDNVVELTPEQYHHWCEYQYLLWQDCELIENPANTPSLSSIKGKLKSQIDAAAETERLRYITPGTGQAMTYSRKVEEAKRLLTDADPTAETYPLLAASVGIDGVDIASVATVVLAMDAAWAQIGAEIERIRLTAKQAVDDAADEATARAVVEQLAWPVITV